MRKEHDPLGYKEVPSNAYYGIHTQRAKENFKISGLNTPTYFYHAIAQIKLSAIRVNAKSLNP